MNFPENPYEIVRDEPRLPRDEQGKVIIPSQEMLSEHLAKLRELMKQQWPERVWDQR